MPLLLVCDTSLTPDSTRSESELLGTADVASARMHTTISCCLGSSTQWLTLTVNYVAKPTLPIEVIPCFQLPYNG